MSEDKGYTYFTWNTRNKECLCFVSGERNCLTQVVMQGIPVEAVQACLNGDKIPTTTPATPATTTTTTTSSTTTITTTTNTTTTTTTLTTTMATSTTITATTTSTTATSTTA